MSLRDVAKEVEPFRPGSACGFVALLDGLDAQDRSDLLGWLPLDSGKSHSWISEVLAADGHDMSAQTVSRHRRGKCRCVPRG